MRRILLTALALLLAAFSLSGKGRPSVSTEWGAGISLVGYHRFNYRLDDGYRMQGTDLHEGGHVNGYWLGCVGYDINPAWNLSVCGGYEGIEQQLRLYPVTLRATRRFFPERPDGLLAYAEGGVGFWGVGDIAAVLLRSGVGYRLALSSRTDLSFFLTYRMSTRNPDLFDPDSTHPIPGDRIALNQLYTHKLAISIAISFR